MMTEPWFSQEVAQAFAFLSLLSLAAGLTVFARRGEHRTAVMTSAVLLVAFGAGLLLAGLVAVFAGQPPFVIRPLLLAGSVVTIVCAVGFVQLRQMYAEVELRRMSAADL